MVGELLDQSETPSIYALGLVNDNEPWDPDIHDDAVTAKRKRNKLAKPDYWESELQGEPVYVVEDRIVWLLKPVCIPPFSNA